MYFACIYKGFAREVLFAPGCDTVNVQLFTVLLLKLATGSELFLELAIIGSTSGVE